MTAKRALIAAHITEHAIRLMCRALSVSPGWFHARHAAAPSRVARQASRDAPVARIDALFEDSHRRHGAPQIHAELDAQGVRIARKTVAKLMKDNDIRPPRRCRRVPRTTDSRHDLGIAPNLVKQSFKIRAPDTVWLADISYVPTDEGWLYLAAVKDMATMEIVGWSMSDRLKSSIAVDAMRMALQSSRPPPGLICHSDRGVQYASGDYRRLLKTHEARASMSGKGNRLDNAPMESFFGSLEPVRKVSGAFHELGSEQMRGVGRPSMLEHRRSTDDEAGAAAKLTFGRLAIGSGLVAELARCSGIGPRSASRRRSIASR